MPIRTGPAEHGLHTKLLIEFLLLALAYAGFLHLSNLDSGIRRFDSYLPSHRNQLQDINGVLLAASVGHAGTAFTASQQGADP